MGHLSNGVAMFGRKLGIGRLGQAVLAGAVTVILGAVLVTAFPLQAMAGVTQKTVERSYWVSGKTPRTLVSYMRRNPTRGDRGAAWANIRPRYSLNTVTKKGKKNNRTCAVRSVNMHINFVMTLPRGRTGKGMSRSTLRLWRSFTRFTRAHELKHRNIYMSCARSFAAKARRTPPAASCGRLKTQVNRAMRAAMKACDNKHRAFDKREARRLQRHPLLRAAQRR